MMKASPPSTESHSCGSAIDKPTAAWFFRWGTRAVLVVSLVALARCVSAVEFESLTQLSDSGSDRATRYRFSNKVVTLDEITHVAWLDWESEAMIATYDQTAETWAQPVHVGSGADNHGGPALAIDSSGYLHMIYGPHHGPLQYAVSTAPNDASSWTTMPSFGQYATYPSVVIDANDTVHVAIRGGSAPRKLIYQSLPSSGSWSQARILAEAPAIVGFHLAVV